MNKNIKNDMVYNQQVLENNMNVYSPEEAFYVGTIFKTLDEPYMNYRITSVNGVTDKEILMMEVQKYGIFVHDLDLYLDVYPMDTEALKLRKKFSEMYKMLIDKYNTMYEPISLNSSVVNANPFPWSTKDFPWGEK